MKAEDIVLIGVKRSVIAYRKDSGERLWTANLASGLGESFVSLIADETRVYAHTRGELRCLDLFTGEELWRDSLAGYGHGVASVAVPGGQCAPTAAAFEKLRQEKAAAAPAAGGASA
jgi:outer membrane protein assembly factor BamB